MTALLHVRVLFVCHFRSFVSLIFTPFTYSSSFTFEYLITPSCQFVCHTLACCSLVIKDLVAKLQSAVLPRKRVKKVIDMVWSDHASTAEQGCGKTSHARITALTLSFRVSYSSTRHCCSNRLDCNILLFLVSQGRLSTIMHPPSLFAMIHASLPLPSLLSLKTQRRSGF